MVILVTKRQDGKPKSVKSLKTTNHRYYKPQKFSPFGTNKTKSAGDHDILRFRACKINLQLCNRRRVSVCELVSRIPESESTLTRESRSTSSNRWSEAERCACDNWRDGARGVIWRSCSYQASKSRQDGNLKRSHIQSGDILRMSKSKSCGRPLFVQSFDLNLYTASILNKIQSPHLLLIPLGRKV
jgi:hypothetical protein